jgi:hypothetical protein
MTDDDLREPDHRQGGRSSRPFLMDLSEDA